ncbi:MAG: ribbon-helix-helix protein, CopG family [Chloroflexi bacterium]|nr:ribbon-helix-helix protein, CopG family [Chloroflexota bacterium]
MTKAIQITIDEQLLRQVDDAVAELGETRSAFIRDALRSALRRFEIQKLERQHAAGYARQPVRPGEFDVWESEQMWGDE